ncbi:MAG TPA: 4-hydroxyphenylacetate 3-hydroxylase N-terminal domain-containing protein [Mycobacteriales bacterium]|jgi:anthranilate 3-monooxygenase (FAD)/4-hydroxyphenylacetate 3-monooxygenase
MARTGKEYTEGLRDGREVWLGDRRIDDVTQEPAFAGAIASMAEVYDAQNDERYAADLTFTHSSGEAWPTSLLIPKSVEDVRRRGRAFRVAAERTHGLMGRSPDFMNSMLTPMRIASDFFGQREAAYQKNIENYYDLVGSQSLCLTHALLNPQVDRSKSVSDVADPGLALHAVRETDAGVVVSGARLLATLAPFADEIMVALHPGPPLREGEEAYAMAFAIPVATPGLRMVCREPLSHPGSDRHPLATRYDEMDAFVIFDEVLVPWDRMFIYRDVEMTNTAHRATNTTTFAAHQTTTRATVKAELALAIATLVADTIGVDGFLGVQEKLGEMVDLAQIMKSAVAGAEYNAKPNKWDESTFVPDADGLLAVRGLTPFFYPRMVEIIQQVSGSGLINVPAGRSLDGPMKDVLDRFYQARSASGERRLAIFGLAWDLAGDGFGSRQLQYERFYAGDPTRLRAGRYASLDKKSLHETLEHLLVRRG